MLCCHEHELLTYTGNKRGGETKRRTDEGEAAESRRARIRSHGAWILRGSIDLLAKRSSSPWIFDLRSLPFLAFLRHQRFLPFQSKKKTRKQRTEASSYLEPWIVDFKGFHLPACYSKLGSVDLFPFLLHRQFLPSSFVWRQRSPFPNHSAGIEPSKRLLHSQDSKDSFSSKYVNFQICG